jgi:Tfp pilus assembly protein PilN
MTQTNTSMNFLPEDYVEKRQANRAAWVFIGLLLAVVGGIVGAYLYTQWKMHGVFAERDRISAAYDDASKKIAQAQELERQKERLIQKADTITALMEKVKRSALMAELTRARPAGVNFMGMELKSKEVPPPVKTAAELERAKTQPAVPPPPPMVTVTLTGTAPTDADVAAYMTALQKSPLLSGVSLTYSEEFKKEKENTVMRRFNVEMHINPDADLRAAGSVVTATPKN